MQIFTAPSHWPSQGSTGEICSWETRNPNYAWRSHLSSSGWHLPNFNSVIWAVVCGLLVIPRIYGSLRLLWSKRRSIYGCAVGSMTLLLPSVTSRVGQGPLPLRDCPGPSPRKCHLFLQFEATWLTWLNCPPRARGRSYNYVKTGSLQEYPLGILKCGAT